ncbi:hypothetical protein QU38_01595, partial [Staphylococcus aureus]
GELGRGPVVEEDGIDGHSKDLRKPHRQRQARVVFVGLDRIDRLARDAEQPGQITLAEIRFGSQHAQSVLPAACPELCTI